MTKKASRLTAEELEALVDSSDAADENDSSVEVKKVEFAELEEGGVRSALPQSVSFVLDVSLPVEAVLGTTDLTVKEVLEIGPGAVVELDRAYGEPVELFLNGRLVARGDVVIIGEQFGVKVTEILVTGPEMEEMSNPPPTS